jgi:Spy/CpxP family protein refolding chaperone
MKLILVATFALAGLAPASGIAQDTVRTSRRVDRRIAPRDTVRFAIDSIRWTMIRDSLRYVPRDSTRVRWALPKDSVRWLALATGTGQDTARTRWNLWNLRSSTRPAPSESWTPAPALQNQNGNAGFAQHLFPPELVMQHQTRLRLTEQQRTTIVQEINRLQATAVNVQWRVADESEKLSELLSHDSVAETAALEQVNKVIEYETAVKRAQLAMLIRIRNVLTAEQRAILRNLQKPAR